MLIYLILLTLLISTADCKFPFWAVFNGVHDSYVRSPRSSTVAVKTSILANDSRIPWNIDIHGRAREYSTKNNAGACGYKLNSDYEQFAALHKKFFAVENSKNASKTFIICKQDGCVQISGKIYIRVADICINCRETDVDLSTAAFRKIWGLGAKVQEKVEWTLVKCSNKIKHLK